MQLDEASRHTVRSILRRHVPGAVEVLVFGSRAHGRNVKPFSDLDLCLRGHEAVPSAMLEALGSDFRESDLAIKVDVVDWHCIAPAFRDTISKDLVPFDVDVNARPGVSAAGQP